MTEPKWETVWQNQAPGRGTVDRFPVPGGWLYTVDDGPPVFVPHVETLLPADAPSPDAGVAGTCGKPCYWSGTTGLYRCGDHGGTSAHAHDGSAGLCTHAAPPAPGSALVEAVKAAFSADPRIRIDGASADLLARAALDAVRASGRLLREDAEERAIREVYRQLYGETRMEDGSDAARLRATQRAHAVLSAARDGDPAGGGA